MGVQHDGGVYVQHDKGVLRITRMLKQVQHDGGVGVQHDREWVFSMTARFNIQINLLLLRPNCAKAHNLAKARLGYKSSD